MANPPRTIELITAPQSALSRLLRWMRKGISSNPWGRRWLAWRLARRPLRVNGHPMYVDPADSLQLYYRRIYEEQDLRLAERTLQPGDFVIDIGAHVGCYTLAMARRVGPRGRVVAFEPNPANFALLKKNLVLNGYGQVTAEAKAVSDRAGTARLYLSGVNTGDHGLYDTEGGRLSVEVPMVRLDDYLGDRADAVRFIKMDIQGGEAAALAGMAGLLARSRRLAMLIEFVPYTLAQIGVEPESVLRTLRGHGFTLFYRKSRKVPRLEELGDFAEILRAYPPTPATGNFTNLFCVKGDGIV